MTQKQINEAIKLIAKFDGVKIVDGIILKSPDMHRAMEYYGRKYNECLQYNHSYSWLMPVWEKIGNLKSKKFVVEEMLIGMKGCSMKILTVPYSRKKSFYSLYVIGDEGCDLIFETIFMTIVDFLKWYNKNK